MAAFIYRRSKKSAGRLRSASLGSSGHMLLGSVPAASGATVEVVHMVAVLEFHLGDHPDCSARVDEALKCLKETIWTRITQYHRCHSAPTTSRNGTIVDWLPCTSLQISEHLFVYSQQSTGESGVGPLRSVPDIVHWMNASLLNEPLPCVSASTGAPLPLWQVHLAPMEMEEGVAVSGKAHACAMVFRMHHAVGDGISMLALCEDIFGVGQSTQNHGPPPEAVVATGGLSGPCATREKITSQPKISACMRLVRTCHFMCNPKQWVRHILTTKEVLTALVDSSVHQPPWLLGSTERQSTVSRRRLVLLPDIALHLIQEFRRKCKIDIGHSATIHEALFTFISGITRRILLATNEERGVEPGAQYLCLTPATLPYTTEDLLQRGSALWRRCMLSNRVFGIVVPLSVGGSALRERAYTSAVEWHKVRHSSVLLVQHWAMLWGLKYLPLSAKQAGCLSLGRRVSVVLSSLNAQRLDSPSAKLVMSLDPTAARTIGRDELSFQCKPALAAFANLGSQAVCMTCVDKISIAWTMEDAAVQLGRRVWAPTDVEELLHKCATDELEEWERFLCQRCQ